MDNVVDIFFEVTVSADRLVFAFDWLAVAAKSWIIKSPGYIAVAQRLIDSQECDLQWPDILSAIQISKSRLEGHFIEVPKGGQNDASSAKDRWSIFWFCISRMQTYLNFSDCEHFILSRILLHAFSHWQNNFAKIFKLNCLSNMYEVERIVTKDMFLETVEKKERKKKRTQIIGCVSLAYL